ncbi:MAG TPA: YukJ family protein [Longimicrobiaceae bacterium]|nr:YukJ family protein [Longimicrobiaceae bacterium]
MPIHNYGVLKGRVVSGKAERRHTPHYQVLVDAGGTRFRVAVGTRSARGAPDLLFHRDDDFEHPHLAFLAALEDGFHPLAPTQESGALDYVRGSLVQRSQMRALPADRPGPDNDLNEKIGALVARGMADRQARLYAFGGRWGPDLRRADAEFGFRPGNGVHDIHMNQGSPPGRHAHDNGAWQDGALFLHFPAEGRWSALFLAFQSQRWN